MNTTTGLPLSRCLLGLVAVTWLIGSVRAADQPNVLIIMADDCTYNDLPLYGGANAKTPNIDRLAAEGLTFDRAYLCQAICQPCRAELFSGQFPIRNGCAWNHSASRSDLESMPHYLGRLGYRVGLAGKVHVKPDKAFPFESVPGFDPNCVRNPTLPHDLAGVRKFMTQKADEPFCLVIALVEPHVPWVMGDPSQYPPKQIKLPPNIADTPQTRRDFGRYLAEITYMDGQVGEILETLEATGKADDTLVLFTSEQGSQFPGNKWTNWDTGVHTALIARWPGKTPKGKRTPALVQYADVLPTLIDAAGTKPDIKKFDGRSFLSVLTDEGMNHRRYVYNLHNNLPEGPAYPIRSVSDGTYRYIRNLTSDEIYIEKHLMGLLGGGAQTNPYWSSWLATASENPHTYKLVKRYMHRPADELYHTADDPYELTNRVNDPKLHEVKTQLRTELNRWMRDQQDPGQAMDTPASLRAARQGKHSFGPNVKE